MGSSSSSVLVAPGAWAQPRELPAKLVTLGGTAELYRKGTPAWAPAVLRADVGEGDSVRTQLGGRVTIRTASGQALRLGSRSQIALLASEGGDDPGADPGAARQRMALGRGDARESRADADRGAGRARGGHRSAAPGSG